MNKKEKNNQIMDLFAQSQNIAILPNKMGGIDAYCAAAGLYYVLQKNAKNVSIIYTGRAPEGCEEVFPTDKLTTNIKERDLVIAVDYGGTEISKVQYTTEGNIFYLRLGPVMKDFDLKKVSASLIGAKNDLFIIIGARQPDDLGPIYHELEKDFLAGKVINIDITDRNTRFGHYNIVDNQKESLSLLTLHTALDWEFVVSSEAAQAFLKGISTHKTP